MEVEALVKKVIREVMEQYSCQNQSPMRVLILLDESGQPEAVLEQSLRQLMHVYPDTVIALSEGARNKYASIRKMLTGLRDLSASADARLEAQLADFFVYPAMPFQLMVRLADGIVDDLITALSMEGFLRGKPMIGAGEECLIARCTCNEKYKEMLQKKRDILCEYGMHLVSQNRLLKEVQKMAAGGGKEEEEFKSKRVITLEDLTGDVINAPKGSIITPAAKEAIIKQGIRIAEG